MGCDKPQRPVGAVADSDPRGGQDVRGPPRFVPDLNRGLRSEYGLAVERARNAERPGEASRPGDAFDAADQHAPWHAIGFGNQVQALVDAVNQVDVGAARRPEDDARPRRYAARSVRRPVAPPQIRLHLHDRRGHRAAHEHLSQQVPGDGNGIPGVEGFGQDRIGSGAAQWVD